MAAGRGCRGWGERREEGQDEREQGREEEKGQHAKGPHARERAFFVASGRHHGTMSDGWIGLSGPQGTGRCSGGPRLGEGT